MMDKHHGAPSGKPAKVGGTCRFDSTALLKNQTILHGQKVIISRMKALHGKAVGKI